MDKRTQKITNGAAVIAIFTVMILLNRQTGEMFQEILMFLFPIPMVAFSVRYGWKSSMPVLFAMGFFAFLFGTPLTVFYAVSEAFTGLVLGECVYRKADQTMTMFLVMMINAAMNVIDIFIIGALVGVDINSQVTEMKEQMTKVFEVYSSQLPPEVLDQMLNPTYLKNMMLVAMLLLGAMQGFIIYQLSLLILRRLQFHVQKPQSLYYFLPPKWTGYVALLAYMGYTSVTVKPLENVLLNNAVQTLGICSVFYLVIFGFIAMNYYMLTRGIRSRLFRFLISMLIYLTLSFAVPIFGLLYIVTDYRRKTM